MKTFRINRDDCDYRPAPPLVKGGCGRSRMELIEDLWVWFVAMLFLAAVGFVLGMYWMGGGK